MGSPSGGKEVPRQSSRALLYANDGLGSRRKRAVVRVDRLRAQPENVHPGGEHLAQRVSAGEADRVAPGQQIPQTGDETELLAFWSPELHVKEPDGLDLPVTGVGAPGAKREHRRRRLRGLELPVGKTDRSDERCRPDRAIADRPRHPRRGGAVVGRETFLTVIVRDVLQALPLARPKPSVAGSTTSFASAAAAGSTRPAPWRVTASPTGEAEPTKTAFSSLGLRSGRACTTSAAAPATTAAAALEPVAVAKRARSRRPGRASSVARPPPGATTSGRTRPSKASPPEEKAETRPVAPFPTGRDAPRATATSAPLRKPSTASRPAGPATAITGRAPLSSRSRAPAGRSVP